MRTSKKAIDDHLAIIALTDHNTFSGWDEIDDNIIPVIRGIEWTTYYGHLLVLGANDFVDWRDANADNIDEKIKQIKAVGGLVGVAHPFELGSPLCTGGHWDFNVRNWQNVDYIEVWHKNLYSNKKENEKALELWTSLLDKGYKISATYGRDWHREENTGHYGCTYLDVDDISAKSAMRAIRLGKTVISHGAKFIFRVHRHGVTSAIGDTVKRAIILSVSLPICTQELKIQATKILYIMKLKLLQTAANACFKQDMTKDMLG